MHIWKRGYITPIYKADDSFDPSNYRGITVTSNVGKLFTLVINERLVQFLDENKVIALNQIGFRRGHRTADHLFILNTIINSYFKKGKMVYVCFIDFSKAYDTVGRVGLFYKLIKYGLSLKFIKLIENMYSNILYAVKLSDGITPFFSSNMGVRQGCNLSPMLFNLFINDINKIFEDNIYDPIHIKDYKVSYLLYADDLLLMSETESGLTHCLQSLNKYTEKWSLTISEKNNENNDLQ